MNTMNSSTLRDNYKGLNRLESKWRGSRSRRILAKVFALLLTLTMQTVYIKINNNILKIILYGLLIITGFALIAGDGRLLVTKEALSAILLWCTLFLLIPVAHFLFIDNNRMNIGATILISGLCISVFIISSIYAYEVGVLSVLQDIADSILIITTLDLVLYIVGQTYHYIAPTNTVTVNWGGIFNTNSYYNLLFTPQGGPYHNFSNGRFTGIFVEAPMCAFMIALSLIIKLFIDNRKVNLFEIVILLFGIYVTVSTTGYIVAILCVGFYFSKILLDTKYRILVLPAIILMIAIIATLSLRIYNSKETTDLISYSSRLDNFESALDDFDSSPIYGVGFKSDTLGLTRGNTSVYSNVLQQGGILFSIWYFGPLVLSLIDALLKKNSNRLIALVLYCTLLYSTVVTYTPLSICIIAAMMSRFLHPSETQVN